MSTKESQSETAGIAPEETRETPQRAPLFDPLEIGVGVCGAALFAAVGLISLQGASSGSPSPAPLVSTSPATPSNSWARVAMTPAAAEAAARGVLPPNPLAGPAIPGFHGVGPQGPTIPAYGGSGGAGGLGRLGPLNGPLSASLPGGEVSGPQWRGAPLPAVGARAAGVPDGIGSIIGIEPRFGPGSSANVASSEIPDARTLELSRLANPESEVRPSAPRPVAAPGANQDKPLHMSLVIARPKRGINVGEFIPVRISADSDCYIALLRVDTDGKASTAFRSPSASQSFTCAVKAGPGVGPVYLVAVASTHPLSGAEALSALRNMGGGFPALTTTAGGTDAGSAWTAALNQAGSLGGAARPWQRYEWAVATGSFLVPPPRQLTSVPPVTRQVLPKPATDEGSVLPTPEPSTAKTKPATPPAAEPSLLPGEKSEASPTLEGTRPMLPTTNR